MQTRTNFHYQLESLDHDLQEIGRKVQAAISRSLNALERRDATVANWVITDDAQIDESQHRFEERVMIVMATQQPVARDLRRLVGVLDISDELERIGDYAKGIARVVVRHISQPPLELPGSLMQMGEMSASMLADVLEIAQARDTAAAEDLCRRDSQLDALNRQAQSDLLEIIRATPALSELAVDLLRVAHNLERIGDRATNIAERVIFMESGETLDLNP